MLMPTDPSMFSPKRAARICAAFEDDIEKGAIPGAVALIARRGSIHAGFRASLLGADLQLVARLDRNDRIRPISA